jgi:Kef-type K+ transport system membrane component KefB
VEATELSRVLIVVAASALAPLLAGLSRRLLVPVVVVEIVLGIVIGPQVLGLAHVDSLIEFLSQAGLAFLFLFAGLEIDVAGLRGQPLRLAAWGWLLSATLAYAIAAALATTGLSSSDLFTGAALCTTTLGALVPILRDAGQLHTRFGSYAMGIGAVGELGPIVLISVLLTSQSDRVLTSVLIVLFVLVAVVGAIVVSRVPDRVLRRLAASMHTSGHLPTRIAVLVLVALVALAAELGLDVIVGAFAAGIILGIVTRKEGGQALVVKLEGMGYGLFVPVFFIASGMTFDLDALLASPASTVLVPIFLLLFLLARGVPIPLLYRRELPRVERVPLGLLSATALPLIVAITTLGVETGHMSSTAAAGLVGAGMLSMLLFPLMSLRLLARSAARPPATNPVAGAPGWPSR